MKRILFLSNHFITLFSFRRELIAQLAASGHDIYLSLPESEENSYFEALGCHVIPTPMDRRGIDPLADLKLLNAYRRIIRSVEPDIIFSYTIKPNIYGTLVSNLTGHRQVCNITGTGGLFLKKTPLSLLCMILYRMSVRKCHKVFFQNTGDLQFFRKHKLIGDNYALLPGSGCDLQAHRPVPMEQSDEVRFLFIGRVMKLKGIDQYLQCAEVIRKRHPNTRFYIAGWNEEPAYRHRIAQAEAKGDVVYLGFRKDISQWIAKCHCTVLPSLGGEGVPNVLLESAATGRPCIASRISGSMDAVEDGVTGFLFEPGNTESLIRQVERFLALAPDARSAMGLAGRAKIEGEFDRKTVIDAYCKEVDAL